MIVLIGDTHGAWHSLFYTIDKRKSIYKNCKFIIVGDANVGFNPQYEVERLYPDFNKVFEDLNSELYIVRGNHDNPKWFDGTMDYSHIKFVPDNTVLTLPDYDGEMVNILCLAGAISINRTGLTKYKTYFPDEGYKHDPEFLKGLRDIHYVVSHNAPDFCPPNAINNMILEWATDDKTLLDELRVERNNLSKAYDILVENNKIRRWIYGHMHQYINFTFDGLQFRGLDTLEFVEL